MRRPCARNAAAPVWLAALALAALPGCATMRRNAESADLRPCADEFACTADGWRLGIRRFRPAAPDPNKRPVVLCHGLGLNGCFWTITDDHLPGQLAAAGYEVFVVDLRGSGESRRIGPVGSINAVLRQGPFPEIGEGDWTMDDLARYDVPAILDHVRAATGQPQVDWVGHSLGGMLMFPFLEDSPDARRVANFVGMGSPAVIANAPDLDMLWSSRALRGLLRVVSTGRLARPMVVARIPGLATIDRYYYNASNVERRTVSRFYGYALEAPSRAAFRQLETYLRNGHLLSADGRIDYAANLTKIRTPTLLIAGDGDIMADVPSHQWTLDTLGSPDKSLLRFGRREGDVADYGHCDLVWSRRAPAEVFPAIISWLDQRQGHADVGPGPASPAPPIPAGPVARADGGPPRQ